MDQDWHTSHFACFHCDLSLTGHRYVLRDEHAYCINCYETMFAHVCEECKTVIGTDSKVSVVTTRLSFSIIRPHCLHNVLQKVSCVAWFGVSVCLGVGCTAKTGKPIEMPFWGADLGGPKEPCVRWRSRSPGKGQFLGLSTPLKALGDFATLYAKTAEPIMWAQGIMY